MNTIETEHYKQLEGFMVVRVREFPGDEVTEPCPLLVMWNPTTKKVAHVIVSQDPEMNGPGFLFIEPVGKK